MFKLCSNFSKFEVETLNLALLCCNGLYQVFSASFTDYRFKFNEKYTNSRSYLESIEVQRN